MKKETPFRIALVAIALVAGPVGVYHRLRARTSERISHREEGYIFASVLRLAGLAVWISLLGYLIIPSKFRWAAMPLPDWLRWSGAVSGIVGVLLMYWTMSSLGKNLTDTVVARTGATLVTHGPYRWVRHPFYVT